MKQIIERTARYEDFDIKINGKNLRIRKYESCDLENITYNKSKNWPTGFEWHHITHSIQERKAKGQVTFYGEI